MMDTKEQVVAAWEVMQESSTAVAVRAKMARKTGEICSWIYKSLSIYPQVNGKKSYFWVWV